MEHEHTDSGPLVLRAYVVLLVAGALAGLLVVLFRWA